MRAVDLIAAKRDGETHSDEELGWLIREHVAGRVPDYQMSAWLMAVRLRGLAETEVEALTDAMVDSGTRLDLRDLAPVITDKHSTGGVGDKVTLVLGPVVAACGLPFAKMSGRGLGHTGGTLDKLESIPGFRVDLSAEELRAQVRKVGIAVAGQTEALVPADRLLYALRDATATVDQEGLIAASVMSKKIAAGTTALVLDVTVGEGAFFRDVGAARRAAELMQRLGRRAGLSVACVISAMDQPLGRAVGNALEVEEAVRCLEGDGPGDLRELVGVLAGQLLLLAGRASCRAAAERQALATLDDGGALACFRRWVAAQGGPAVGASLDLPQAPVRAQVLADSDGWVGAVHARSVARACVELGAGRELKGAEIDPAVGVVLRVAHGETVRRGDILAEVHAGDPIAAAKGVAIVARAYTIERRMPAARAIVIEVMEYPEDGRRHRECNGHTGPIVGRE